MAERQSPTQRMLKWFDYTHLPAGPGRDASAQFRPLAHALERLLPDGPEKTAALRRLLDSKDCAVRAAIESDLDAQHSFKGSLATCSTCHKGEWAHRLPGETSEQFTRRRSEPPAPLLVGRVYRMVGGARGALVRVTSIKNGSVEVVDEATGDTYGTVSSNLVSAGLE